MEDWAREDQPLEDDRGTPGTVESRLPGSVGGSLGLEVRGRERGGSGGGQADGWRRSKRSRSKGNVRKEMRENSQRLGDDGDQ